MIRIRQGRRRPVMLAIAGDSAAGKSTLANGIVESLGAERCQVLSTDDYHRYDRAERAGKPFTALSPDCHHLDILAQHLQLLATGQPILKPVYDHGSGSLTRPMLVEPAEFVIVEGLLPLHSKLARSCFDVTVYLDPADEVRRDWKLLRDTTSRGYTREEVLAELAAREPESAAYIRPQHEHADIVVRFAPIAGRNDPPDTPLSVEVMLRSSITQPDLAGALQPGLTRTVHLSSVADGPGQADRLHVHGYAAPEDGATAEKLIWNALGWQTSPAPDALGRIGPGLRSTPLAIAQMVLLHHLSPAVGP